MLKKVIGGTFWSVGATFSQLLLQLAVLAALGRLLTPEDFGLVGIATAVTAFATFIGQLGIGQALVQRPGLDERTVRSGFTLSLLAGIITVGAVAAAAGPLAAAFNEPGAAPFIRLVVLSVLGTSLGLVADALLQREMRFRARGLVTVISYVMGYAVVAVPLAALGHGAWSLAWAVVVQAATKSILSFAYRPHDLLPIFDSGRFGGLLSFGGRITVSKLLNTLALQGDNLVVARALGPTALGLYSRSYQLMLIPVQLIGQTMANVLYPALSQVQHRRQALRDAYLTAASFATLLGSVAATLFVVLAPEIIAIVLGPGWEGAILPFRILSIVIMLRVAYKLDDTLAKATGALNARLVRDVIYGVAIVLGAMLGVRWGLPGTAIAVGSAIALNHVLGLIMSLRITGTSVTDYLSQQRSAIALAPLALIAANALRELTAGLTGSALVTLAVTTACLLALLLTVVLALPRVLTGRQRQVIVYGLQRLGGNRLARAVATRLG